MGGTDEDPRSDLDRWLESQRIEMDKLRQRFQDGFDKEVQSWKDDTSSSSRKGPFERFKDFVDLNFSTFAQGFRNFPSNVSELKAKMQEEREARRLEELDITRRWVGVDESPDHISMQVERQSGDDRKAVKDALYLLLRESYRRNQHVAPDKILKLYQDNESSFGPLDRFATPMLSMGGACYYKTETVENLPSTARWGGPAAKPQWLSVEWFKRSPYSPIRLEAHPDLHGGCPYAINPKWRMAFEDLLNTTLDKSSTYVEQTGYRPPFGTPQSTLHGPGLDWMLSLQCRGILPPQLPSLYKPVRLFDGFDEVRRPRVAEFMHDMDKITADQATRMYPLVKRDLELLMDEIAIKSGPPKLSEPILQSPWRVPDTEEGLYDQMPTYTDLLEPVACPISPVKSEEEVNEEILDELLALLPLSLADYYDPKFGETVRRLLEETADLHPSDPPFWYFRVLDLIDDLDKIKEDEEFQARDKDVTLHETAWLSRYRDAEKRAKEATGDAKSLPGTGETPSKPDILSQLTTTHTTRMPDGSITTKVVLKQRFSDGREEVHENVQTSRDEETHSRHLGKTALDEPPKKKGWFWN